MQPFIVIEFKIAFDALVSILHGPIVVQINIFIFERPPEPFNEDIVHGSASAVHADFYAALYKHAGKVVARKLRPLVRVEYIRLPTLQHIF